MHKLVKKPLAETDLVDIWIFSFENWGEAQADRYLRLLDRQISKLLTNPLLGKSRDQVRAGYRSIHAERHVIYYCFTEDEVEVVRILHDLMEPVLHL